MKIDLLPFYRHMLRSRRFEELTRELWIEGKISGEMHLGIGEEAVVAGVVAHLQNGDAMALDHRGTPALVMRGVDLKLLLREFLGQPDGLCGGRGGHMHLFSKEYLAASSGIVGSACPWASGMALAAQYLHRQNIAVAFLGEGAMNQGMVLESLNLAVIWKLPVLFVCKDNRWAISTRSRQVTGGQIADRVRGFGMAVTEVDGSEVEEVWKAAAPGVKKAREGKGPSFLLARCPRLEGHFLGDPLLNLQAGQQIRPILGSLLAKGGAPPFERLASLGTIAALIGTITVESNWERRDPMARIRRRLKDQASPMDEIDKEVEDEMRVLRDIFIPEP
jgi:acetoin:2,6-dichlorophenolindophenol oxidoreductase subunit alpha